jgi:hypothetical protein
MGGGQCTEVVDWLLELKLVGDVELLDHVDSVLVCMLEVV